MKVHPTIGDLQRDVSDLSLQATFLTKETTTKEFTYKCADLSRKITDEKLRGFFSHSEEQRQRLSLLKQIVDNIETMALAYFTEQ